jgi:hypothetical protein
LVDESTADLSEEFAGTESQVQQWEQVAGLLGLKYKSCVHFVGKDSDASPLAVTLPQPLYVPTANGADELDNSKHTKSSVCDSTVAQLAGLLRTQHVAVVDGVLGETGSDRVDEVCSLCLDEVKAALARYYIGIIYSMYIYSADHCTAFSEVANPVS